ncbi:MAG: hypothetical protein ACTSU2_13995 [Promethearchaeota archaeon]
MSLDNVIKIKISQIYKTPPKLFASGIIALTIISFLISFIQVPLNYNKTAYNGKNSNNKSKEPPLLPISSGNAWNSPEDVPKNSKFYLPRLDNEVYYMKTFCHYPLLMEVYKSECFSRLEWSFYDSLYNYRYYSKIIYRSDIPSRFFISNYSSWYFFTAKGDLIDQCSTAGDINNSVIIYEGQQFLKVNTTYTATISHNFPNVYYLNIKKDYSYKLNFVNNESKDIEMEFLYNGNNTISYTYYNYTLYNNGLVNAKFNTTAMLLMKCYQSGSPSEFNFTITELPPIIIKPKIDGYSMTLLIILIIPFYLAVGVIMLKKRHDKIRIKI